jgi:hypothetical protein
MLMQWRRIGQRMIGLCRMEEAVFTYLYDVDFGQIGPYTDCSSRVRPSFLWLHTDFTGKLRHRSLGMEFPNDVSLLWLYVYGSPLLYARPFITTCRYSATQIVLWARTSFISIQSMYIIEELAFDAECRYSTPLHCRLSDTAFYSVAHA